MNAEDCESSKDRIRADVLKKWRMILIASIAAIPIVVVLMAQSLLLPLDDVLIHPVVRAQPTDRIHDFSFFSRLLMLVCVCALASWLRWFSLVVEEGVRLRRL